jgi:signal transduction histidine kinase
MKTPGWRLDGLLAVAGFAALVVEGLLKARHGLPVGAYPLAAVTAAAVAFRRHAPVAALVAVEAGAIACVALFQPSWAALTLVTVALFTVAELGDRRRSLLVGAVTAVGLVATILLEEGRLEPTHVAIRLPVFVAALALGDTVRSRRALEAAELAERRREEREREAQSRRRVSDERLRIARDLHDTLAHALVAINVRAGVAAHLSDSQDPGAALLDIKSASADALRDLRVTLGLLRERGEAAPVTPALGLSAVPDLIERAHAAGLDAHADIELNGEVVPSPVAQAAFRIVQESLTNVLRHAGAASAHVVVRTSGRMLEVDVTDDGRGGTAGETSGHGLRGMTERVTALGGQVSTGPRLEGGWRVHAQLPMSPASTDGE